MNIQAASNSFSLYYYKCLDCRDSFICPDWKKVNTDGAINRVAICPYCKSNQIDALNSELPLMV